MTFARSLALAVLLATAVPREGLPIVCCSAFVPSSHASIGATISSTSVPSTTSTSSFSAITSMGTGRTAARKLAIAEWKTRRGMSAVAEEAETSSQQSSSVRQQQQHADQCPDDDPECITRPRGATNPWEVHKFGGASLATAELYRTVGDLLIREAGGRGEGSVPTMA